MARRLKAQDDTPAIGHNSAAEEEASRVQLISIMAQYDAALGDLEIAQAPVKAARKKLSSIKGLAKAAGIPAWRLEQRHDEMQRPSFENAENIAAEANERRWLGIITPEQLEMHMGKSTPQEVRDAEDWRSAGYRLGLVNKAANLPEGMDARFTQDFMRGHEDGRKSFLLTLAENAPKPKNMTAQQVAEQAARDFAADNPEPGTPEAAKAERAAIRKAKESLDKMQAPPEHDVATLPDGTKDDGFEATPDELAAQAGRPSTEEPVV